MSFHPLFHQDHQNILQALIHTYMCKEAQESTIDGVASGSHIILLVASQLSTYNKLIETVFKMNEHHPFFLYYRVCLETAGKMLYR